MFFLFFFKQFYIFYILIMDLMDGWMDGQTGDTAAANVVFIMINMMTKWQISDMSDEEYIYTHTWRQL